jgi:hypothetical protein
MRKGITVLEETEGNGTEAVRGKAVIVNLRMFLPDGSELVELNRNYEGWYINLARRDVIAGIRYGIEGMRAGGRRIFLIRSHLAYGAKGVPGKIPPHTNLRCEVQLLEVGNPNEMMLKPYPLPGKRMIVFQSGELARSIARWQFTLTEDGRCNITVTMPIPGLKWRHSRPKYLASSIDPTSASSILNCANGFPNRFPKECVPKTYSGGGDSGIYIDEYGETLSVRISVFDGNELISNYDVAEDNRIWRSSELFKIIDKQLTMVLSGAGKRWE